MTRRWYYDEWCQPITFIEYDQDDPRVLPELDDPPEGAVCHIDHPGYPGVDPRTCQPVIFPPVWGRDFV